MKEKLFLVHLRRPKSDPTEMRSDPFWEFGSFGTTGCHGRNLLNINKIERLKYSRFAFVQGGGKGFKLLLITPALDCHIINGNCEVKWVPTLPPFKYSKAPIIIDNAGKSDFRYLINLFSYAKRTTLEGKFSSVYRSNVTPLNESIAKRLYNDFQSLYQKARKVDLAANYTEALPWPPPKEDTNRQKTYSHNIRESKAACKSC